MSIKEFTEREKSIYKAAYMEGRDDALDMLSEAMDYVHKHLEGDINSPEFLKRALAAGEKRLRLKGSTMTIAQKATD